MQIAGFSILPQADFGATCFFMSAANGKSDRLAAALRANLARRKAQSRARRTADAAETGGGTGDPGREPSGSEAPRPLAPDGTAPEGGTRES
ncbi:MAG: hypothetical protein AB7E29_06415 [Xanthobacter sp.]